MILNVLPLLTLTAVCDVHCKGTYSKIEIGDPCGIPYGSGRWMYKHNTFGCYRCDVGEYWDLHNNECSACNSSLTSCQPNVLSSACSQHWRDCEGTSPITPTETVLTDQAATNTLSTIISTTSIEDSTNPTTKKELSSVYIQLNISPPTQSYLTLNTTVKTTVEHNAITHTEPWVYITIGVVVLLLLVIIAICILYKRRITQRGKHKPENVSHSEQGLLGNNPVLEHNT